MNAKLPDALADALGRVIAEERREWQRETERMAAESRAVIAEQRAANVELRAELKASVDRELERIATALADVKGVKDGKDADPDAVAEIVASRIGGELAEIRSVVEAIPDAPEAQELPDISGMIEEAVAASVATLPPPPELPDIPAMVNEAVAALPAPQDGKDADPDQVAALVVEQVKKAVSELPAPKDGKDADPKEVAALVVAEVEKAVAALPKPQDGQSVTAEDVRPLVEETVSAAVSVLPVPENGKDADEELIFKMLCERVDERMAAIPHPKDGVGLAGALINREGALVLTLTDGSTREVGQVVGRDADRDEIETMVREEVGKIPKPRDGLDGVGFNDMDIALSEDERTLTISAQRGDNRKEWTFRLGHVLDRGVYREGETYAKGDGVTWGGSFWIAQRDTAAKPGDGEDWRLSVKKGRDGKDGVVKESPKPEPVRVGKPKGDK